MNILRKVGKIVYYIGIRRKKLILYNKFVKMTVFLIDF